MDNCLVFNLEMGGVGCDNMIMIIVVFFRGWIKEEWYEEIVWWVVNGDGFCVLFEYGREFLLFF